MEDFGRPKSFSLKGPRSHAGLFHSVRGDDGEHEKVQAMLLSRGTKSTGGHLNSRVNPLFLASIEADI